MATTTQEIGLRGLRVALGKPRVVAEGTGFCFFPGLVQFSTGELMVTHALSGDSLDTTLEAQRAFTSRDGGET